MTHRLARLLGASLASLTLLLAMATHTAAAPIVRFQGTLRAAVVTTGNTLGLAGSAAGPSTTDGIGVFTDATATLQAAPWPLGTTADWHLASSDAVLDVPAGATIVYAELVWGGSVSAAVVADLDSPIVLTAPSGQVHSVAPDALTAAPANGTMRSDGYYGRSANVTAFIEGAGSYRVGAVPATLAGGDAAAGWGLYVVYTLPTLPLQRVAVVTVMESVGSASTAALTGSIDGICIPESAGARDARLSLVAMEGDANITGETVRCDRTDARLAMNEARITGIGTTLNIPHGGHITSGDGVIDTRGTFGSANHGTATNVSGARQGWDIITFDATAQLPSGATAAFFRNGAGGDSNLVLGYGLQVKMRTPHLVDSAGHLSAAPTILSVGGVVTLTMTVPNDGDATAANVTFRLPAALPAGLAYVTSSLEVDGAAPPGGPVTAAGALQAGVDLGPIAAGQTITVTLSLRVDQPLGLPQLTLAPQIAYSNQACGAAATPGPWAPAPVVITLTVCGDGLIRGDEGCDDGNTHDQDGCSASCAVEYGWTCAGLGPSVCSASCGDGRVALGAETCDDGDAESLDGCSATCVTERGWSCGPRPGATGTPADPDTACAATCGDGLVALGVETCDDGNTSPVDGCSAACAPEPGWSCGANPDGQGTTAAPDTRCVATCGDGQVALGVEGCDDGNTAEMDGCSESCALERGWLCPTPGQACVPGPCGDGLRAVGAEACDDGDSAAGDGCSATCTVEPGFDCVHTTAAPPDSVCASTCGDGRLAVGSEGCDDLNTLDGDGCAADCGVELGWSCSATPGELSSCHEDCGDGRVVGAEGCDDQNSEGLDGCAADCGDAEHGWSCVGAPSVCTTTCGDSLIGLGVGGERCDDGNTAAGDGCDCGAVELGWSCGDPPLEPSVCEPYCGDGYLRGVEGCDDGNVVDGDGCTADCRAERGWICRQEADDGPSICHRDTDEDGVLDDGDQSGDPLDNPCAEGETLGCDDNCPDFANADQTFPSGAEATFLCPPYRGPRTQGGGGGCAGGPGSPDASWLGALALVVLWSRRRLAVVVALVLLAGGARAQNVDPRLLDVSLSPLSVLGVETSATPGHLSPWLVAIFNLANDEVVTRTGPSATDHGPLSGRVMVTLGAGIGILDRLDLAVGLPLYVNSLSTAGAIAPSVAPSRPLVQGRDVGLADLRFTLRARVFGPRYAESGVGLALLADVTLPTGSEQPFMSDGAVTFRPRLVLDYRAADGLAVALNVGYRLRPERTVDDLGIGDELHLGLGAELPVGFDGIAFLGEVDLAIGQGHSAYDDGGVAPREVPAEALGGLRWRSQDGWVLTGAAGSGITQGYGAPDFRLLLSLAYNAAAPRATHEPLVPGELVQRGDPWDEVRPPSRAKRAQTELTAERFDAVAAADRDADSDGVPLPADQCPSEPEDIDGFMDEDGCPDPDNDQDGVLDAADKCPDAKENINGNADDDGCPDDNLPELEKLGPVIVIKDKIMFKSGSAELLDSDKLIIEQLAVLLNLTPEVARFRIEGHTDNQGDREFNVDLGERRAWAVLAYLVEQGVARERLFAKGFGPTRPIASNNTDQGRAANRRVEFHVIKPGEPIEGDIPATSRTPVTPTVPDVAPGGTP